MRQLQDLARAVTGTPSEALQRLLVLTCEQLGMDIAFLCALDGDGNRVVRMALQQDGTPLTEAVGATEPLEGTWCGHTVEQDTLLVGTVASSPLRVLAATDAFNIRSYAGVALRDADGVVLGTLSAIGHQPHASLNPRDASALRTIGSVVAPLLAVLDRVPARAGAMVPAQRRHPDLPAIADVLAGSTTVEQLSRPLLDALHEMTGLGSSYLTVIHEEADLQEIRYSLNTREGFALPEGLHVPWADTLCKRALDEGRPCTTNVADVWADSAAARDLGIEVYVSVPVELSDGQVWGTLCAADSQQAEGIDQHLTTMRLFARLIAAQVEREAAVARAVEARRDADTDSLTGCAVRRVAEPWLSANLASLTADEALVVAFVDVDRFKTINDAHGHLAGDAVLAQVGARLQAVARPGDLVARWGGDEFVLAARLPRLAAEGLAARFSAARRVAVTWEGAPLEVGLSIGVVISDRSSLPELLNAADEAMYALKRSR